jgi:hypothetical protein
MKDQNKNVLLNPRLIVTKLKRRKLLINLLSNKLLVKFRKYKVINYKRNSNQRSSQEVKLIYKIVISCKEQLNLIHNSHLHIHKIKVVQSNKTIIELSKMKIKHHCYT